MPQIAPNFNQGFGSYNISLNLTSLFTFPSKLLSRIGRKSGPEPILDLSALVEATKNTTAVVNLQAERRPSFPGPWGFFGSKYAFALGAMALLMHRIPNIVVPPRQPFPSEQQNTDGQDISAFRRIVRKVHNAVLPLDVNQTSTRLALHLPTLYFMVKTLTLWTVIVLQASHLYPFTGETALGRLGAWSEVQTMQSINWSTFCSICAAFCVEGFVRGLDGAGIVFGTHMHANTSPFNLVGYAFLLHIYASPATHTKRSDDLPTRPDKHALITIAIPLIQLTMFHCLSIRKRWSNHRLIPTAISSVLSLLHFHLTLLTHSNIIPNYFQDFSGTGSMTPFDAQHSETKAYPLLNYMPNILETLLLITICLTIFLNAITQFLLLGRVTKPLFGLGLAASDGSTTGTWSWSPPWDEDFGILLLRVGIASLEATGLRGWANEVGFVLIPGLAHSHTVTKEATRPGTVQMNRAGDVHVSPGYITTTRSTHTAMAASPTTSRTIDWSNMRIVNSTRTSRLKRKELRGWNNEIKDIHVGVGTTVNGVHGNAYFGIPGVFTINLRWFRIAYQFLLTIREVLLGFGRLLWALVRGKPVRLAPTPELEASQTVDAGEDGDDRPDTQDALYQKFVTGGEISDDEELEHEWEAMSNSSSESESDEDPSDDPDTDAVGLYSDLIPGRDGGVSSSTILAHMTNTDGSPLTRRRYQSLLAAPQSDSDIFGGLNLSRPPNRNAREEENRRNCVICTVEAREIICWPCRCLSMCDFCRENLASQLSASKHRCPCCRRTVDGYSRIYIP